MPKPRVLVLRSPGANCDEETAHAFRLAGAEADRVHIARLVERPSLLDDAQVLCIPGGFSYGDDVAAGRVLGNQLRLRLAGELLRFRDADKLVLGVCNGFQVLLKTGLLDVDDAQGPSATLTWNRQGRYEARWVRLCATPGRCVMLQGVERIELPVAHAEGQIAVRDDRTLVSLAEAGRIVLRYGSGQGQTPLDGDRRDLAGPRPEPLPFPQNPNGSIADIAGLCDTTGRVLGLMPHPERYVDATHHPAWARRRWERGEAALAEPGDGLRLFENAVRYFH